MLSGIPFKQTKCGGKLDAGATSDSVVVIGGGTGAAGGHRPPQPYGWGAPIALGPISPKVTQYLGAPLNCRPLPPPLVVVGMLCDVD